MKANGLDYVLLEDVQVTPANAPKFLLNGEEVDIWSEPYIKYHSKAPDDYVRERILDAERRGIDPFPDVVGKKREKALIMNALLSGSPILLKGKRGYGKTTISKAIAKLLPERQLSIKECKIYDDPTRPSCFSCKRKIMENNTVELAWIPRIWVRIPGDPMLTTRQLIGGLSIQKIREGYDLDHPEVFIPGRALKANRGVGYFDELGAVPSSLQTLLHELFEENQVTTLEGELVPFKVNTLELASTNPANYKGTNPIKEPLLDRMEEIEIGPPEALEEEVEIGVRNMYVRRVLKQDAELPLWHQRILARAVRYARSKDKMQLTRRIESEPSCRATIKLFDHVKSHALRNGRSIPLLRDYGENNEIVKLAMRGRIEVEYGASESKDEIIDQLLEEAVKTSCREIYDMIPSADFEDIYAHLWASGSEADGQRFIPLDSSTLESIKSNDKLRAVMENMMGATNAKDELWVSALEILLHSISLCVPRLAERSDSGYLMREWAGSETRV